VQPAYLAEWLPGTLLMGLGIGLTFPVLSAAAVSSLPAERFGVGSAVNQTARQVGGSIGVAILVVILGARVPGSLLEQLGHYHALWFYGALMAGLSGAVGSLLGKPVAAAQPGALRASSALRATELQAP
jgi:MFS family permease